jgi:hypothetical protein
MIAMPDVDSLMAGGLGDWLESQRAVRAETKAKIRRTAILAGVIGTVLTVAALIAGLDQMAMLAAVCAMGIGFARTAYLRQQVIDTLKTEMNGALANALDVDYQLKPEPGPEFDLALEYDVLPGYDDAYFQDRWQGNAGDTDFLLYEAKLTETRGSGKSRRTVTVFKGVILRFRFARAFLATTLVRRDGFKFSLFGDDKKLGGQVLERISMVDPRFEDAFDVYGSDPVEGRYLVHPAYCERLLELETSFAGEKLCALFHGGDLLVTIHTDDMFESATLDPAEDRALLGQTIEQFASITRLIQTLNERPRG